MDVLLLFFLLENESERVGPGRGRPARKVDAKPDKVKDAVCLSRNARHLLARDVADVKPADASESAPAHASESAPAHILEPDLLIPVS